MNQIPSAASKASTAREYPMEKKFREDIPDKPGIYRMFRSNGDLLYVGKAKSLKHRVSSYFRKSGRHSEHILEMLSQARSLNTSVTGSAVEAALLESDEIKRLSPPYNIALREKDRRLHFFSRDFSDVRVEPEKDFSIGPVILRKSLEPLSIINQLLSSELKSELDSTTIETILGSPPEYAPEPECFILGMSAFKLELQDRFSFPLSLIAFMKLGGRFWKIKMEELAILEAEKASGSDDDSMADEDSEEEVDIIEWTPERVTRALKSIIRRGIYLIRRARWLGWLSESTLVWDTQTDSQKRRNLMVITRGKPDFKGLIATSIEIPFPSGYRKSFGKRQKSFDLKTYDRLRVLTTEIRRLLGEDRGIELHLGPNVRLKNEKLNQVLKWV